MPGVSYWPFLRVDPGLELGKPTAGMKSMSTHDHKHLVATHGSEFGALRGAFLGQSCQEGSRSSGELEQQIQGSQTGAGSVFTF